MATLWVFGDEAGVMPIDDSGEVFVAATVGVIGEPPLVKKNGHRKSVIDHLVAAGALPAIAFVRPSPEYARILETKISRMSTMARATRLTTGANARYLLPGDSPLGSLRNTVWQYAMQQAIGQALCSAIARTRVERLLVTLDQKTFADPTRALFIDTVRAIPDQMIRVLKQALHLSVPGTEHHIRRLALSQEAVQVQWSDDQIQKEQRAGLFLAHHVASHTFRDMKRGSATQMPDDLRGAGLTCPVLDVTPLLLAPLSNETVSKWERNTGLRVPRR